MTQLQQSSSPERKTGRSGVVPGVMLGSLLAVFLIAFAYASFLFFQTARAIVVNAPSFQSVGASSAGDQAKDGVNTSGSEIDSTAGGGDVAQFPNTLPAFDPILNQKGRINILLLGIDQRPGQQGYFRSDTMILLTVEPSTGDMGLLSMPRDLWVTIPGFSEARINSAHSIGDLNKYPGGDQPWPRIR